MNLSSLYSSCRSALLARAQCNKSVATLLAEVLSLRSYPNRISSEEYFALKLYLRSPEEQRTFLGTALEGPINYIMSSPFWFSTIRDKLSFHNILKAAGILTPSILAVYGKDGSFGATRSVSTREGLEELLLHNLPPAYFGKPSNADVGIGAIRVTKRDQSSGTLVLADGTSHPVKNVADEIVGMKYGNYLFQEILHNARELEEIVGPGLSTVRICMIHDGHAPKVFRAFLKICLKSNHNDNWDYGRYGNALGFLDPNSGKIKNLVTGIWPNVAFSDHHPETSRKLSGVALPFWSDLVETCCRASHCFPGFRVMHWDVAITPKGPSLVEMNEDGSLLALQECGNKGFFDDEFKTFLARFGHDLCSKSTQQLIARIARIVGDLYGMDNAYLGRGTLYEPVKSMK